MYAAWQVAPSINVAFLQAAYGLVSHRYAVVYEDVNVLLIGLFRRPCLCFDAHGQGCRPGVLRNIISAGVFGVGGSDAE